MQRDLEWMQFFESRREVEDIYQGDIDNYDFPLSEGSNDTVMKDEEEEKIITEKKLLSDSQNNEIIHLKINKSNKEVYPLDLESKNFKKQNVRLKWEDKFDWHSQDVEMQNEYNNPIIDLTNLPDESHSTIPKVFKKCFNYPKDFDYTIQGESEAIEIRRPRTIDLKKVCLFLLFRLRS